MTFSRYTEKSGPIFKSLKIINIFELNTYLIAVFMYSYHRSFLDPFNNKSVHSYNTRSAANIHIEFWKTNDGKYSIGFKGAIVWNNLPSNIRSISSYNIFRTKSKSMWLRNNCSSFSPYQFVKQQVRLLYSLHLLRIKLRSSKSSTELAWSSCLLVM